jgi:hypothetical protein
MVDIWRTLYEFFFAIDDDLYSNLQLCCKISANMNDLIVQQSIIWFAMPQRKYWNYIKGLRNTIFHAYFSMKICKHKIITMNNNLLQNFPYFGWVFYKATLLMLFYVISTFWVWKSIFLQLFFWGHITQCITLGLIVNFKNMFQLISFQQTMLWKLQNTLLYYLFCYGNGINVDHRLPFGP